jgi:amidohydrolase
VDPQTTPQPSPARDPLVAAALEPLLPELVAVRRDVHAHPETGRTEVRTTGVVAARLRAAGLEPRLLPGTGLTCDIDPLHAPADGPVHTLALRADLDALPLPDETGTPWASTVPGIAHACGHDVHTTTVLGAGLVLAALRERLRCRVRLVFQPAEETNPGGALDVLAAGGLAGVDRILAVHCDPHLDTGRVGLRVGPITSAADHVKVVLSGDGGHTSRPHLTGDLVFALGQVVTGLPAALSRRLDPRAGASLVWGRVSAGGVANAIPRSGEVEGTLRVLDAAAWARAGDVLAEVLEHLVAPLGIEAKLLHSRGVPPTVNEATSVALLEHAARTGVGPDAVAPTEQSLGGEDFAWYLEAVPGALARLGTRAPGGHTYDLHRGDFEPDEAAIGVGVRLLVAAALSSPHSG